MKKSIQLFYLLFISHMPIFAGIGTTSITIVDANRANRNIPCDVYYPATSSGVNTPISNGQFGLVVIGHGFFMGTDAYKYLGDSLSNAGYIVAVVNTETGLNKGIQTFGKDLAIVADNFIGLNNNTTSFFQNHVKSKAVIIGHSMGGLAAFSGANSSNNIAAIVNLSAADSGGIASAICAAINKPNFSITGTIDCVAPTAANAKLMYDALKSDCKYYMNITGATHCGMADNNLPCTFGESCIIGQSYISRGQQQQLILQPLYLYLNHYLNGNAAAFTQFNTYISSADSFVFEKKCGALAINNLNNNSTIKIYPNPVNDVLIINGDVSIQSFLIQNIYGQIVKQIIKNDMHNAINVSTLSNGIYTLIITDNKNNISTIRFQKQ
jgi:dienelactone hydrolase